MSRPKRIPRPARCPTMVAMHLAPEVSITERLAVDAVATGRAEAHHFNVLADCHDLMVLAADYRRDQQALRVLVDVSEDFWKRQSGELFRAANAELDRVRGIDRRAAA